MKSLVLYNYFRSSSSYRVRIALNLKGLEYEYKAIHLLKGGGEQHSAEFRKLNPSGEVPCLVHEGKPLAQSMAIIEYIEKKWPNPSLFPADPYLACLVRQACELINSGIQPMQNLKLLNELDRRYHVGQEGKQDFAHFWIEQGLKAFELLIDPYKGSYCFGETVTAADAFLMPQLFAARRFGLKVEDFPLIARIEKNLEQIEAIKAAHPNIQPDFS